jgi:hypothetical protein
MAVPATTVAELRVIALHDPAALDGALRALGLSIGARKRLELVVRGSPILLSTDDGGTLEMSMRAARACGYVRSALEFSAACGGGADPSAPISVPFDKADVVPVLTLCEGAPSSPLLSRSTLELVRLLHVSAYLQAETTMEALAAALTMRLHTRPPAALQADLGLAALPAHEALARRDEALFESPRAHAASDARRARESSATRRSRDRAAGGAADEQRAESTGSRPQHTTSSQQEHAALVALIGGEDVLHWLLRRCDAIALHKLKQLSRELCAAARTQLTSTRWCATPDDVAAHLLLTDDSDATGGAGAACGAGDAAGGAGAAPELCAGGDASCAGIGGNASSAADESRLCSGWYSFT